MTIADASGNEASGSEEYDVGLNETVARDLEGANAEASVNEAGTLNTEEYDVGLNETVADEVDVVVVIPTMASETVNPEIIQDPLGREADGFENVVDEGDQSGHEYVEYLKIESLDDTGASAVSVKDESAKEDPLDLTMLNVSIDNNDTIEGNTSDCAFVSEYMISSE